MKPMKAPSKSPDIADVALPVMASCKLDGLRAAHVDGNLVSKTMNRFPNLHISRLFANPALGGLDGELVVGEPFGNDVISRANSGIRSINGTPDVHWWVFDDFTCPTLPFTERFRRARNRIKALPADLRKVIHVLPHPKLITAEEVLKYETEALAAGYEGLMLRSPDGPYKFGTCTAKEGWLFKFKRFVDGEFRITAIEEGRNNDNEAGTDADGSAKRSTRKEGMKAAGVVGGLRGIDLKTKKEIKVAPGRLTKIERVLYFQRPELLLGKIGTYRSFPTGTVNAPRFPTFQALRDKADM